MTAKEPPLNVIDPPRSTDGFRAIREEGWCFVDKTDVIARLADVGDFLIFLRPRASGRAFSFPLWPPCGGAARTPSGVFARKAVGAMNRAGSW